MFDWIRDTPLELSEKNKEKKAFRLIYENAFLLLHIVVTFYIVILLNRDTKIAKKRRFSDDSWKTSTWFQLGLMHLLPIFKDREIIMSRYSST